MTRVWPGETGELSRIATAESVCTQIRSSDILQKGHSVAVMMKD
jgi:hypothetical protein